MNTQKENNKKKQSQKTDPFSNCGDFQKMAEMMKKFCPGEGNAIDCCSIMRRMMGQGKGAEAKETKVTQKPLKGEEND